VTNIKVTRIYTVSYFNSITLNTDKIIEYLKSNRCKYAGTFIQWKTLTLSSINGLQFWLCFYSQNIQ